MGNCLSYALLHQHGAELHVHDYPRPVEKDVLFRSWSSGWVVSSACLCLCLCLCLMLANSTERHDALLSMR